MLFESIKVTNNVIEKPIKITQEMWRKGDDFKEFKDQEYYLEVSYASEVVQSKVVEVKDNAPTTKPETRKSMSKVARQEKEQAKEETKCICKQYDLIWGRKIGCKERKKVVEVCKNIWGEEQKIEKANMLMAIMHLETAGTFSPSADNKKGYVGLIQFSGSTARGLGTTSENLKKMTFVEQMNYVEKYLRQNKDKMKTLEDFYLQVMKPSAVGNGSNPNFVIFDESIPIPDVDGKNTTEEQRKINITKEPWATKYGYSSNPSFMKEKDEKKLRKKWVYSRQRFEDRYGFEGGKTYVWEITEEIRPKHYDKGQNHKFVGECVEKEKEEKKVGNGRAPWMETAMEEYSMYKEYREKDDPLNNRIKEYHNTTSLKPLKKSSPQYDGKTPWCSSFVNFVMETSGYGGTNSARAYSWKKYGKEIKKPVYGAIAVCNWSHVAFVVGKNKIGNIVLLGGNQGGDFPDGKKAGCQRLCYTSGPANKMRFYIPLDYEVSSEELEILEVNNISDYESSR